MHHVINSRTCNNPLAAPSLQLILAPQVSEKPLRWAFHSRRHQAVYRTSRMVGLGGINCFRRAHPDREPLLSMGSQLSPFHTPSKTRRIFGVFFSALINRSTVATVHTWRSSEQAARDIGAVLRGTQSRRCMELTPNYLQGRRQWGSTPGWQRDEVLPTTALLLRCNSSKHVQGGRVKLRT